MYTYLQSTYFLMFFAILCAPIVDGHAVYFLLLPGPGGIIHKLLSGISPLACRVEIFILENKRADLNWHAGWNFFV